MCFFYIIIKKIFITIQHFKNFLLLERITDEIDVNFLMNSEQFEYIQNFINKLSIIVLIDRD